MEFRQVKLTCPLHHELQPIHICKIYSNHIMLMFVDDIPTFWWLSTPYVFDIVPTEIFPMCNLFKDSLNFGTATIYIYIYIRTYHFQNLKPFQMTVMFHLHPSIQLRHPMVWPKLLLNAWAFIYRTLLYLCIYILYILILFHMHTSMWQWCYIYIYIYIYMYIYIIYNVYKYVLLYIL